MTSRIFYDGTQEEVQLGDRIEVRRWLRKPRYARVCYIPGISSTHPEIGLTDWAIRYDDDSMSLFGYSPDDPHYGPYIGKSIKLLSRNHGGELLQDERLEAPADAINFVSDLFDFDTRVYDSRPDGVPRGNDLAVFLRQRLIALFPNLTVGEPADEDIGTTLQIWDDSAVGHVLVHWAPVKSRQNRWGISIHSDPAGCLGVLFGWRFNRSRGRPLEDYFRELIASDPMTFTNVEWHSISGKNRISEDAKRQP